MWQRQKLELSSLIHSYHNIRSNTKENKIKSSITYLFFILVEGIYLPDNFAAKMVIVGGIAEILLHI